jgi:Uracil DNA glycosylase superfamily
MTETVTSYHQTVKRTSCTIDGLIAGTACYPGGAGLWRGEANGGPLPECFPQSPVMFVAHNFDSNRGFALSFARRGEAGGEFWQRLLGMIAGAGLSPDECFFTNALMGLKPGRAEGDMPSVAGYKDQCQHYLKQQVEIVKPRAVIALGVKAEKYVSLLDCSSLAAKHPKHRHFHQLATRDERLLTEGKRIGKFISQLRQQSYTGPPHPNNRSLGNKFQFPSKTTLRRSRLMTSITSQHGDGGADAWGFRFGTRNSFLMRALEIGGKSKETIKSEFLHAYPSSAGTSTFGVFFTDAIRPFGSASVSRSIRIETDSNGHLSLDPDRALAVKAAIAKGLLKELSAVEKSTFPKKDLQTIEAILHKYRVPLK